MASITNPTGSNVPASHEFTPKSTLIDALGRTIETTEHIDKTNNPPVNNIVMQYRYDIRGNLLLVKDPYNRNVFEHVYDLRTPEKDKPLPPLWTKHIDKGESTVLFDVQGKPLESHDAKGAMALSTYDVISRPVNSWARNDLSALLTMRGIIVYGDTAGITDPELYNLNGVPYQSYDEAGLLTVTACDFKGNVLIKGRQVIDSAVLKAAMGSDNVFVVDWTGLPSLLDSFMFQSDMSYDALNRVRELELPTDLDGERKKIIPAYNTAGALEKVDLYSPLGLTMTNYVENIVYNAKGQRLLIAFGNNMMTRYVYDDLTFRLLRQRSEKYTKSTVGNIVTYDYDSGTNKQDDGFNYDLVGNIMKILNRVSDCGINGTGLGDDALNRNFTYDPVYRLMTADGRESDTQNGDDYLYTDAPTAGSPNANHVRAYERSYAYDKLGNVQSVIQSGTNGFTRNFVYNTGQNTLQKIEDSSSALIEDYTYDDCGNQITAGSTRHYIWNHADQLICYYNAAPSSRPTVFAQYDYSGQDRVSKMVKTGGIYERTIYIDGIFEYIKLEDLSDTYEKNYIHIMDDSSRIAEVRVNVGLPFPGDISDDIVYNLEDQIGSSTIRLDDNGTIIDKEEYYPFGDSSLRTFKYKRYRYVGKERDAESGLYYYGARYYAAWTCRFISVDPLASKYNQLTPYQNAGNNPINDYDIDGMQGANTSGAGNTTATPTGGTTPSSNSSGGGTVATQTNATAQPDKGGLTTVSTYSGDKGTPTLNIGSNNPPAKVLDEYQGSDAKKARGPVNLSTGTGGYFVNIPANAITFPDKSGATTYIGWKDSSGKANEYFWRPEMNAFSNWDRTEIYGGKGVAIAHGYMSATTFGNFGQFSAHPSAQTGMGLGFGQNIAQLSLVGISLTRFALKNTTQAWWSNLKNGGPTFEQYRAAYWKDNVKPTLGSIPLQGGESMQVWMELHHNYIPQRSGAPNWAQNNMFNLVPLNTIRHAIADPYRMQMLPKEIKIGIGLGNTFGH